MAHHRHRLPVFEDLTVDMSPMIDLVFLLLIFFMTSSTLVTHLKEQRVELPVAPEARVVGAFTPRTVINVYADGAFGDERGRALDPDSLAVALRDAATARPDNELLIRSDRRTRHGAVQQVLAAAREAGLTDVVFSTYTAER